MVTAQDWTKSKTWISGPTNHPLQKFVGSGVILAGDLQTLPSEGWPFHDDDLQTLSSEGWPFHDDDLHSEQRQQSEPLVQRIQRLKSIIVEQRGALHQCLEMLDDIRAMLEDSAGSHTTSITSVTWNEIEIPLRLPLIVILQEDEEEVVARIPEFSSSGFGRTESEALADVKSELGSLYKELAEIPEEELGILPKRWKQGLDNLVIANG